MPAFGFEIGSGKMSVVDTLRIAATMFACFALSGCFYIGEAPAYHAAIHIKFPGVTLEQAMQHVLSAGTQVGFRKGGEYIADGMTYYKYNERPHCRWSAACIQEFRKKQVWREKPEIREGNAIKFWLSNIAPDGSLRAGEPIVKIEQTGEITRASLDFVSWPLDFSPEEKASYHVLKRELTNRFGAYVTTERELH